MKAKRDFTVQKFCALDYVSFLSVSTISRSRYIKNNTRKYIEKLFKIYNLIELSEKEVDAPHYGKQLHVPMYDWEQVSKEYGTPIFYLPGNPSFRLNKRFYMPLPMNVGLVEYYIDMYGLNLTTSL